MGSPIPSLNSKLGIKQNFPQHWSYGTWKIAKSTDILFELFTIPVWVSRRWQIVKYSWMCLVSIEIIYYFHYLHYQYHYYYSNYHYDYTINDYDYSFMYLFLQKTDSLDTAILELWLAWPLWYTYRLMDSTSELSGVTVRSSLTMNEKFQYRMRLCRVRYRKFQVHCQWTSTGKCL